MIAPLWRSPAGLRGETTPSTTARDMILREGNSHPHYQVIALSEDRAWIVDLQSGINHVIPIDARR